MRSIIFDPIIPFELGLRQVTCEILEKEYFLLAITWITIAKSLH